MVLRFLASSLNSLFRRKCMRKLRQLSMAVVFTLALSASAFAGIIGGGPDPPPAPPEPPSATATGLICTSPRPTPKDPPTTPVLTFELHLLQSLVFDFLPLHKS